LNLATVEYRNNAMKYEGQESGTDYSTLNPQCLIPLFVCGEDRIAQARAYCRNCKADPSFIFS
jgi:hypothetical protein